MGVLSTIRNHCLHKSGQKLEPTNTQNSQAPSSKTGRYKHYSVTQSYRTRNLLALSKEINYNSGNSGLAVGRQNEQFVRVQKKNVCGKWKLYC